MNVEPYNKLLTDFKSITSSEPYEPTFMDLSRYPHYENVCSNILAFYFDRNEAHKMDDMLLLALCKTYDDSFEEYHFDNVEVKREVLTSGGKYIDILIEDDKYIVAIENKIFHEVDNDLQDYSRYIDKISKGREKIKILLSLYKADEQELKKQGFKNILYAELIGKIEETIGRYVLDANTKYLNYMIDFIKTLKRQERGSAMNREFIRFLSENENEINRLLVDTSEVRKEFRRKLQELSKLIEREKYGETLHRVTIENYMESYTTHYITI